MNSEQLVDSQPKKGESVRMDMLLKEYEVALQDLMRENLMLKALLAQKRLEEVEGLD